MATGRPTGLFLPDSRNIGGRQYVIEDMLCHIQRLNHIRNQPSRLAFVQGKKKKKGLGKSKSRRKMISGPPDSYYLGKRLSQNRKRASNSNFDAKEHEMRKWHMLRRISEYDARKHAQQNPSEITPHTHQFQPSRIERPTSAYSYDFLIGSPPGKQMYSMENDELVPSGHETRALPRSPSAHRLYSSKLKQVKREHSRNENARLQGQNPYHVLKSKLYDLIIENRIYKAENLLKLFEKAEEMNSHLDQRRLRDVLDELKAELMVDQGSTHKEMYLAAKASMYDEQQQQKGPRASPVGKKRGVRVRASSDAVRTSPYKSPEKYFRGQRENYSRPSPRASPASYN
jgi:hypothetical protein